MGIECSNCTDNEMLFIKMRNPMLVSQTSREESQWVTGVVTVSAPEGLL